MSKYFAKDKPSEISLNVTLNVSLSNPKCTSWPTFINLHPSENTLGLCLCLFAVGLGRREASCNTLNDLSNKVCVPNKTEDLNLSLFNMFTGIND